MHFAVHITLLVTVPNTVIVPCLLLSFLKKKKRQHTSGVAVFIFYVYVYYVDNVDRANYFDLSVISCFKVILASSLLH